MRRFVLLLALCATTLAFAPAPARPAVNPDLLGWPVLASGAFQPADSGADALTYDSTLAPVGARAAVVAVVTPLGTTTILAVKGLAPNREYGAHVHVNACGADPAAAGPHVQWREDPVQPSTDPKYANPSNEIWLDLTTDGQGTDVAASSVRWPISKKTAGSVVIHEHHTSREHGEAGTAGPRLACINVPFDQDGRHK
ncbi:superoxide dismutase family protein [Actinopolymorpha alba]|uniref:superoxide dismutase family protein n=1 Tax=Actinopolymorpha alba TaxID=533267 RepID=UPI00037C187C|nr:superoxide dismutase family protein [Actinopolymorpha alba]